MTPYLHCPTLLKPHGICSFNSLSGLKSQPQISSTAPLQSLSMLSLQTSGEDLSADMPGIVEHVDPFGPSHSYTPGNMPQKPSPVHFTPTAKSSSAGPSQSSSTPLQTSFTAGDRINVSSAQSPPHILKPSLSTSNSSTGVTPSQSSSLPLHISGKGSTAPTHGPHLPSTHSCSPCL